MGETRAEGRKVFTDNPSYGVAMGRVLTDPAISEPEDTADTVLFLASDESRTITGDQGAAKV
ncbi:hypothetical protein GCM10010439_17650 [Actinocorallia aurantiaca]|uniref:Enoyl-ACP reductase-like protein n=2 Tax=Actinocorallia aurantiaca TaxID=46204 RepID=A0ABP6GG66_9ACTN